MEENVLVIAANCQHEAVKRISLDLVLPSSSPARRQNQFQPALTTTSDGFVVIVVVVGLTEFPFSILTRCPSPLSLPLAGSMTRTWGCGTAHVIALLTTRRGAEAASLGVPDVSVLDRSCRGAGVLEQRRAGGMSAMTGAL